MLSGTENTLAALIQSELESKIQARFGYPPQTPNVLPELCQAISESVIPHCVSNTQVLPGSFSTSSGPVSGAGSLL